jgi:hypothetical protein
MAFIGLYRMDLWRPCCCFRAQKLRSDCCAFSGKLACFPRQPYNTFLDRNLGCCLGTNFEGVCTARRAQNLRALTCAYVQEIRAQISRSLAQFVKWKFGTVFEISLYLVSEINDCCKRHFL